MKTPVILFCILLALPFSAAACPVGMQLHGSSCLPVGGSDYSMDDWIREKNDYLDSLGPKGPPKRGLSAEELENLKKLQAEKDQRDLKLAQELAQGVWFSASSTTPEGKLCVATFAKFTKEDNGKSGGMVSVLGFQQPKPDAWLIFYGTGLPAPKDVKKVKITLQQDDEPAQTIQAFNYRFESKVGTIAFAVPGLAAALDGMRDKQSFKLSLDGKTAITIQWTDAAPVIEQLKLCSK